MPLEVTRALLMSTIIHLLHAIESDKQKCVFKCTLIS